MLYLILWTYWAFLCQIYQHLLQIYIHIYIYKLYRYVVILFVHLDIVLLDPFMVLWSVFLTTLRSRGKTPLFFWVLKGCGVWIIARNVSLTGRVHRIQIFLWLTSLDNINRFSCFMRICMDFFRTSAVILTFYVSCK